MIETRYKALRTTLFYAAPFIVLVGLFAILYATDPLKSGPLVILIVFVLVYFLILTVLCVFSRLIMTLARLMHPNLKVRLRRIYYFLTVFSMAPVLLIALNTLGQLNLLECILIFTFVGLGCFYVLRRTSPVDR